MFDHNSSSNDQLFGYADYSFPPPVTGVPLENEDGVDGSASNTVTLTGQIDRPGE